MRFDYFRNTLCEKVGSVPRFLQDIAWSLRIYNYSNTIWSSFSIQEVDRWADTVPMYTNIRTYIRTGTRSENPHWY